MKQFLKAFIAVTVLGSMAYAKSTLINPDFARQLANPTTYKFNKKAQESICGANQLQHVSEYDGSRGQPVEFVAKYEQAVAALAYGTVPNTSKYCSGIMISEDLFLTASHCIDSGILNEFAVFNYQKTRGSTDLAASEHFKITEVVEKGLNDLDYAIIRIDGKPGLKYGFTKINIAEVAIGNVLTIIQHPSGKPKMVDVGTKLTNDDDYFRYGDLDTEPGSSGSGVIDQDGFVVGVHTNGGCFNSGGSNAGVLMTKIVAASPTIQALTK
ncbi:serine protease [bacterium]|nr:serine protease [bacterium]